MEPAVKREVAELAHRSVKQLQQRFLELFGDAPRSNNKVWLLKRIAWRLQARAEGGLSERALARARDLADEANLRILPPRIKSDATSDPSSTLTESSDRRLPPPGAVLTRSYKGVTVQVQVRRDGFEFEGELYRSLSAVAKRITGSHLNGFRFFQLEIGGRV